MSKHKGFLELLLGAVIFLVVVSVLSMGLNFVVIWFCRLLICVPQAFGEESVPLAECLSPVEEICDPGVQPSWTGCQVAWEDRPK